MTTSPKSPKFKRLIVRACIIAACFVSASKSHAQEIGDSHEFFGAPNSESETGYCVNYPESKDSPNLVQSKYDALIAYEDWNLDEFIDYLQWTLFTPETESEYILKSDHTIISESAGYTK